jgi:hypothetical protein
MDTKTKPDEAVPDLEQQPLLPPPTPPPADPKLTVRSPERELARPAVASPGTSPATVRTLALVTATVGLAFAVDMAAQGERPTLAAFAALFILFCAFLSLFAWRQGRGKQEPPAPPRRAWPATAAARVMFWSFAMSLVVSMTCWAADRPGVPRAAGSALSALGVVVCWLCVEEIAPFFGRVTVQIAWGCRVREKRSGQGSSEPQKLTQAN